MKSCKCTSSVGHGERAYGGGAFDLYNFMKLMDLPQFWKKTHFQGYKRGRGNFRHIWWSAEGSEYISQYILTDPPDNVGHFRGEGDLYKIQIRAAPVAGLSKKWV